MASERAKFCMGVFIDRVRFSALRGGESLNRILPRVFACKWNIGGRKRDFLGVFWWGDWGFLGVVARVGRFFGGRVLLYYAQIYGFDCFLCGNICFWRDFSFFERIFVFLLTFLRAV